MKKHKLDHDVVVVLISTLITLASWVGFEVYRAYTKSELKIEAENHMVKINSTLKVSTLDILERKTP